MPFSSETLVTGKLFEDIKEAVEGLADPAQYDTIVVTNLCVPTASERAAAVAAQGDQRRPHHRHRRAGFGIPTHAEAKDVLAGAMLSYARTEAELARFLRPESIRTGLR